MTIVLAGGRGSRIGDPTPKQFLDLNGEPVLLHTLRSVARSAEVVVVYNPEHEADATEIVKRADLRSPATLVEGGGTRRLSVSAGLAAIGQHDDDVPLVLQNAASPNTPPGLIDACLAELATSEMAVAYVPAVNTIFRHQDRQLSEVLERASLGYTTDPTVYRLGCFRRIVAAQAREAGAGEMTLDTARALGIDIRLVLSPLSNVKLTTYNDLVVLRELFRTGAN